MLTIALLTLSFSLTSKAQSDSVCYSTEDARILAGLLIDGENCKHELLKTLESYKDAKDELKRHERKSYEQEKEIEKLSNDNAVLEKKNRRKKTWIWILSMSLVITSTQIG